MNKLIKAVNKFRDDRNWRQFHNEKDLVISINLEASELLELFQWKSSEEVIENKREELSDEIADILIYALMLADNLGIDIEEAIQDKLEKSAIKYPIEKSRNSSDKYTQL